MASKANKGIFYFSYCSKAGETVRNRTAK